MSEYHKIQTVFKRDPSMNHKTLLEGDYSLPAFEYLAYNQWDFTEKVDGTNIRVVFDCEKHSFAGRTDDAQMPPKLAKALDALFDHEKLATAFPDAVRAFQDQGTGTIICLYGEGYGASIQKGGGNYRPSPGFVLFDVRVGEHWLERYNVEDIAIKLGIDIVPLIGTGTLPQMVERAKEGIKSQWGDFQAEGIVARPQTELRTRNGHRVITKIKTRDFAK